MSLPSPQVWRHTLLLSLLLLVCSASPSYYIAVPSTAVRGASVSFAIHWFGGSDITVSASITDGFKMLTNTSQVLQNDIIKILTLPKVPANATANSFEIVVNGSFQNTLVFSEKTKLAMQMPNTSIFIQTDKNNYKPGEVVKIRVITVTYDLKPYTGVVDIDIRDPRNNIIQQQLRMKSDLGVISTQFLLANSPMLGDWYIQAKSNGYENAVSILVAENVFDRFDVMLDAPTFYFNSKMQDLNGTVTAKYFNGLPVKGNVTITVRPVIAEVFSEMNKTYNISGSANFSFTHEEISNIWIWSGINITVSVMEELTGIVVYTSSVVRRVNTEYTIRMISQKPAFSAGLTFTAQLQVQRIDNKPLTNEERNKNVSVRIILSSGPYFTSRETIEVGSAETVILQAYFIPVSGIVSLEFPIEHAAHWIQIQVEYQNTTDAFYFEKPNAANPYIEIQTTESSIKVGSPFELKVKTYPEVEDLCYVVIAKGMVVAADKVKTTFSLTPEQSWAPNAQLTVYFKSVNSSFGDIIQFSQMLPINGTLKNTVTLSWSKNNAAPSEQISLSVNVKESRSLVGLRVVEKSFSVFEGRNDLTVSKVDEMMWYSYQSSLTSLSDAIIYNTNGVPLFSFNERFAATEEWMPQIQSRPIFIDTWIWQETNISASLSTSLQVTVPDKNATWVATAFVLSEGLGLGVTEEPIELSVVKALFITLYMPTSLTRGEQFILEVMVSSNIKEDMQVTVALESSSSFDIIVPNNNSGTVAGQRLVTVLKESSATVFFPINPKVLGNISVSVSAKSNAASDYLTKYIIVRAEGIRNYYSQSHLFEVAGTVNAPATVSKNFLFTFPSDVVPGSEEAFTTVAGDLLGPSIKGLESLITMPYGCGEQNMIAFAPNIYILLYLISTNQITEDIRLNTISFIQQGYQRELLYWRYDGSFSAFGNSDLSGSTWLTAFVFRCFLQARPFIYVDSNVLNQTVEWLIQYQDISTGVFSEPGNVIHKELQGGLNGPITITAYIVTSLFEYEYYRNRYENNIRKAVQYLESKFDAGISSNYTLSAVAYALTLANSSKAQSALNQLNSRATITADGTKYWSSPSQITNYWQPRTTDIETSAYALLSFYRQSRIADGIPVMKWLSQQRNHLGGYSSTQDTVMALQALALFVSAVPSGQTSLTLTITGPGSFVPKTFQIDSNHSVLQSKQIDISQPLSFTATASGRGLAICQLNVIYNTKTSSRRRRNAEPEAFSLEITLKEDASNIYKLVADVCMSYLRNDSETGMVMLEFGLLNGFELSPEGIPTTEIVKKVEPENGQVNIYINKLTKDEVCISIPMVRVANVVGSQDAVVKLYEYYNSVNSATQTYNSVTMKRTSFCNFCGTNCTQCTSDVPAEPRPSIACTPTIFTLWFSIVFMYYIL